MSVVVLESISLAFGGRKIVDGLDLRIDEEDRIGLVGRNGTGKSSLMRIIAGAQEADGGRVRKAGGARIGWLPQELDVLADKTLLASVVESVPGRADLEEMLASVEAELETATDARHQMDLAQKLADLHDELAHFDAHFSPHEAQSILAGLGFTPEDSGRNLREFSGGWKMRAVLAALLFQKPDLLMLDEPTNHLDIPTVEWLATFMARYRGALLLICHDREFLNEQVNRIVAYEVEGVRQYNGNYEDYKRQRAEEREILERRSANLTREREQAERFIRRFRAQATKARAVQSRIKALEKMDDVHVFEEAASLAFRFPPCERAGQDVVGLRALGHSYGRHEVLGNVDLTVRRGDKLAIIGANGAGKTTLLKIVAGELLPTTGTVHLGHNVKVGYYAQHVTEKLDARSTIFDEVWRSSALQDVSQVRAVLGTFLFSGDDVDKRIGVLSGGEKARVALASLMVNPGNLLLMDEPTNHLDLESSEALAQALGTYDGTIVFVSHNRSFLKHLATRVWNLEGGVVEDYPGTFQEFLLHRRDLERAGGDRRPPGTPSGGADARRDDSAAREDRDSTPKPGPKPAAAIDAAAERAAHKADRKAERARQREVERLRKRAGELEERIAALEATQAERSSELSRPEVYEDSARYSSLLAAYTEDASKLEELMGRWEAAQSELAAGEAE
jgi:ATP-binding cassette subfamily F protein 3